MSKKKPSQKHDTKKVALKRKETNIKKDGDLQIRYHKRANHPTVTLREIERVLEYLTITHAEFSDKKRKTKNKPFYKNPDPRDPKPAYYEKRVRRNKINMFNKPKPWKLDQRDIENITKMLEEKKINKKSK